VAGFLEGWAKICRGEVDQGIEVLRAGVLGWQQRGARLWLPIFLTLEAEACVEAGRTDAALRVIEEALTISEDTRESWATAEVLRVKARALQAAGRAEAGEIETVLINSLETARRQQARCWELRAACDLARLWHGQGRGTKALNLLESVYEQFTEGFDAPDLRDAKALMEKLKRSVAGKQNRASAPERHRTHQSAVDTLLVYCEFGAQLLAVSKILTSVEGLEGVLPARPASGSLEPCVCG
jgi:predicted ATPase